MLETHAKGERGSQDGKADLGLVHYLRYQKNVIKEQWKSADGTNYIHTAHRLTSSTIHILYRCPQISALQLKQYG
jgi:hypothetical protein